MSGPRPSGDRLTPSTGSRPDRPVAFDRPRRDAPEVLLTRKSDFVRAERNASHGVRHERAAQRDIHGLCDVCDARSVRGVRNVRGVQDVRVVRAESGCGKIQGSGVRAQRGPGRSGRRAHGTVKDPGRTRPAEGARPARGGSARAGGTGTSRKRGVAHGDAGGVPVTRGPWSAAVRLPVVPSGFPPGGAGSGALAGVRRGGTVPSLLTPRSSPLLTPPHTGSGTGSGRFSIAAAITSGNRSGVQANAGAPSAASAAACSRS